jgi:uncharacterized protein YndB with AHSA1/START domain
MAPEQISTPASVDHRADIYSTGVVFYEMLAKELPPADRLPPSRKAGTDPRLDPIVLRATEPERERRYQEARLMQSAITTVARTPESSLRLEKHIAAPPAAVFAAWTDAANMSDWYRPSDDCGPTAANLELKVGGAYRVGMLVPGRTEVSWVSGQYCRIEESRVLSFTWAWETPKPDTQETQVTVELQPRGDGTELVLTHERFRDQGKRDGHETGWRGCLEQLARKLGG